MLVEFTTTESGDRFLTCVINKDGSVDESYNPRQNFFTETPDGESLAVFGSKLVGDNVIIVGGDVVAPGNAFFYVLTKDGKEFSSTLKMEGQPNKIISFLKIDDSEKYAYISGFFTKIGDYVLPYFARVALRDIVPDGINTANINKVEPSVKYNNGMLTVNGIEGNAEIAVYNTKGTAITLCNGSALPIALPLPNGIYIVQIKDANGKTYTNKIIN